MKLLYFAWLRQRIGIAEESVSPPAHIGTIAELIPWLAARGPGYAAAFALPQQIRAAVNQDFATPDHPIRIGDEIAFFPPVTGG